MEDLVRNTVILCNRCKRPEAIPRLISLSPKNVTLAFSGSFCYSGGVLDYIEDFIHWFKTLTNKVELKIGRMRQTSPRSFEADYRIRAKKKIERLELLLWHSDFP